MPCDLHLPFWPAHAPKHLWVPETHLYRNVEVAAMRFPNKPFVIFYDTAITYREFQQESERIAGYLQQRLGVKKGDRVLLYMQNSPQLMAAFYGTPSAVKLLLESGADPMLKNAQGLTAIDFANRANRADAAEIIAAFVRAKQPKGKW